MRREVARKMARREREGGGVKRRRLSGNFNFKVLSFQPLLSEGIGTIFVASIFEENENSAGMKYQILGGVEGGGEGYQEAQENI